MGSQVDWYVVRLLVPQRGEDSLARREHETPLELGHRKNAMRLPSADSARSTERSQANGEMS
jgi:hypothetical protein